MITRKTTIPLTKQAIDPLHSTAVGYKALSGAVDLDISAANKN